jgi:Tol biopolymer transport system component
MDPAWSPTAPQYAFVTDRTGTQQIWLRSSDGQWERPLVTERDFGNSGTQLLETPAFSPDGQRLAYFHSGYEGDASKIWISTLAGGPPVKLTPLESRISLYQDAPTWSPNGDWVAYVYALGLPDHPGGNAGRQHWGLAKALVGSREPPQVLRDNISAFARPQWSPDGRWIVCETAEGLSLVSPDTKEARILSEDTWLAYGWAVDGTHLYGIRQSDDLHRLMFASIDVTTKTERIINPNLGPIPLATPPIRGFSRMSQKSFATSLVHVRSDVWVLEGFERPRSRLSRMTSWLLPIWR